VTIFGSALRYHRFDKATAAGQPPRGFTLIELLVVMSLIVVFATLGLVQYRYSVLRAKEAVLREDLFRLRDAIDQFYADRNRYPVQLSDLVAEGYMRQIPQDPMTESTESWHTIQAEPEPGEAFEAGIFDVKSGSDGVSLDGSRYADW
jgi:general secretion pathway protein G